MDISVTVKMTVSELAIVRKSLVDSVGRSTELAHSHLGSEKLAWQRIAAQQSELAKKLGAE